MPKVTIDTSGCRACTLCVDICPTDVFVMNQQTEIAEVAKEDDCIGCTSCQYLCPSRCLTVSDNILQRPFFRIEQTSEFIERFLQQKPAAKQLTDADWQEALKDVTVRLNALGNSVTETMGRGQKAVGRKAGGLAAAHLPEMYEGKSVNEVMDRLKHRFASSFEFEPTIVGDGAEITCTFTKCAMSSVVREGGENVGEALLCGLFHEYWAGLIGAFTNNSYSIEMKETGSQCTMHLTSRR